MTLPSNSAGGRATEAGMSFEAGVGTWFAAHLAGEMPVGARFGVSRTAIPRQLQFETGFALDDLLVRLSDGGEIFLQCKTRPRLAKAADSDLAETITQLVQLVVDRSRLGANSLDPALSAAVLAVSEDAPRSLDDLEQACRAFDRGGDLRQVKARMNQQQRAAIDVFEAHARKAWTDMTGAPPSEENLLELARLFHVSRFDVGLGGRDWREGSRILGARLFGREESGNAPIADLLETVRSLIRSGAPADRIGLLRSIRAAGHDDTHAPVYERDITRLHELSEEECRRLHRHTVLPIGDGVPIPRDCLTPLSSVVKEGSLLLIGEPGAGKTGVLVALVEARSAETAPTVFLSVERYAGVRTLSDLSDELGLQETLLDVLENWPGREPGVFVIDALDAARGEPSETVFADLIEEAVRRLGERWSVIASIRTFDLQNGRRFREVMKGAPPRREYAQGGLDTVRHFRVPALSETEVAQVGRSHRELGTLLGTAPLSLKGLLRNIFNLSLAAELLATGVSADSIRNVTTQSDLIERYENERLLTARLQRAATSAVATMVERRRLWVRKIDVPHEGLDDVLKTGVMTVDRDLVGFAHHVLFDHIAGRFFLEWNDPDQLIQQIQSAPAIGLLLGPSLRFATELVWRHDAPERPRSWQLTAAITGVDGLDPVIASVALRTPADSVETTRDVEGLRDLLRAPVDVNALAAMLSRLARFVSMNIAETGLVDEAKATAWAAVASYAIGAGDRRFADAARFLLWTLFEKADFARPTFASTFGRSARQLLAFAFAADPEIPLLATNGIRFTAKTFATDPVSSKALLEQVLEEPRFNEHAHEEARWLAEGVPYIAPVEPAFAARIYAVFFGRPAPQSGRGWLGGMPSRILPLTTYREQDYEQARWHLSRSLRSFLNVNPQFGTEAVISAAVGLAGIKKRIGGETDEVRVHVGERIVTVLSDYSSLGDWRREQRTSGDPEDNVLGAFVEFLRSCPPPAFRIAVETALRLETSTSVWTRLLGIAADRPDSVDDLLWPLATEPEFMGFSGVTRDAVSYVASAYPSRSERERTVFELGALSPGLFEGERERNWWRSVLARFLSVVQEEQLVTSEMRALQQELREEGKLAGNRPFVSIESGWVPAGDITDRLLESDGVNLASPPDQLVRGAARTLDRLLSETTKEAATPEDLERIWQAIEATVDAIAASGDPPPHPQTLHASWGSISNGVERVVKSDAYDPDRKGYPDLDVLLKLIEQLMVSPFPEPPEGDSGGLMGWGNWDVRVYAASSLMALARRFASRQPVLLDRLQTMLSDSVPTVRLQVAQSLNALWDVAREPMWSMVEFVAIHEAHPGVLGFFVGGPLMRLAGPEPDRCIRLIDLIFERLPAEASEESERKRDTFEEPVGYLAAQLWVGRAREGARSWIDHWQSDLASGERYLWHTISALRAALFAGFAPNAREEDAAVQRRAREIVEAIVIASAKAVRTAEPILRAGEAADAERKATEGLYLAGNRLIEHSCNQLYFGSGAFQSQPSDEGAGLQTHETMRRFLAEYSPLLERIGHSGSTSTIHHLIELYAHLAAADPAAVFDQIATLLLGPAVREEYQYEALGTDVLVRLVRRYLADHRAIFDDPTRRARLVQVLELFSNAGWPEALRLVYELPDLLR
jgi:hypothetical protein